ncbi:MAG: Hsp70 family protein, partial [Deltaproteobacteria bacterium]|nr:Hsp70 family protein [Deltaproteobacteria bacterium]
MARDTPPRWVVGIDLGTTNCVLAAADTRAETVAIEVLPIPQVVAPKQVEAHELLPSFLYLGGPEEVGAFDLPWASGRDLAVGVLARTRGADVPGRLVASAKSWLCHSGVDRTAPILPWGAEEGARRVSPIAATAAYLTHLRDA